MTNNDFFTSEAFRALITAIEQQHGPISYITACNHPEVPEITDEGEDYEEIVIDGYPELPEDEYADVTRSVFCGTCKQTRQLSMCRLIGIDVYEQPIYLCNLCDEVKA